MACALTEGIMSHQSASEYYKLMKVSPGSGFGGLFKHPHIYQYLFHQYAIPAGPLSCSAVTLWTPMVIL